jgi:prepilin-type N-terminal cleavage/methylation domain-containing protein
MIRRSFISSRSGGFTLIEAVITLIVVGVLATIGATVMSGGFRSYFLGREIAQDDAQGRLALERMARDLRTVRSTADLNIGVANQVSFTDLDGNAIAYRRNAGTSQLERSQNGVAGTYLPLADNVSALTISYLHTDGVNAEPNTGSATLVYYITVELTVKTSNVNMIYRSTVKPAAF